MDGVLKRNTAINIMMGPFIDETDGDSLLTGLTIVQADVRLSKAGGGFAQKSSASAATHSENGLYIVPLAAADVDTRGVLTVFVNATGALPAKQTYMVMDETAYAVQYEASNRWTVNLLTPPVPRTNVARPDFMFMMFDSTTGDPKTGLTVTATRSIDAGAFGACANAVVEVASGWYTIDLDATDVNGTVIALRFTATGAKDQNISLIMQP